ncbi:unnamed protein product [Urochloa decumbens]|uniref:Uncharacterized protein n=1 Tax=Urochloa decumbens TaxID=240449 RepID=A0ABC9H9J0_9POAL
MICRLTAKYRPSMLVFSVAIPCLKTNQLKWSFTGAFEAESTNATNESVLKVDLDHGKASGMIKFHDVSPKLAGLCTILAVFSDGAII